MSFLVACRHPERMEADPLALSQWPDPDLPYAFESLPPGVSLEQAVAAAEWAYGRKGGWASICGLQPRYTENARQARVLIGSRRIDGPGGVLADCYLPQPGTRQVKMQFDVGDAWEAALPSAMMELVDAAAELMPVALAVNSRAVLYALVLEHEGGHSIGLGHAPQNSPNVMAPAYNRNQLRFGSWDIAEAQRRYGKPVAVPSPPVTPTNPVSPVSPSGDGFMGKLLPFLTLLTQLAPLIKIITDLANSGQLSKLLDVLRSLATALDALPAGTLKATQAVVDKDALKARLREAIGIAKLLAAWTPGNADDQFVAAIEQALLTDWVLELLVRMLGVKDEYLEAAIAQAQAAAVVKV